MVNDNNEELQAQMAELINQGAQLIFEGFRLGRQGVVINEDGRVLLHIAVDFDWAGTPGMIQIQGQVYRRMTEDEERRAKLRAAGLDVPDAPRVVSLFEAPKGERLN